MKNKRILTLALLSILLFSYFSARATLFQPASGSTTASVTIGSTGTIQQAPPTGKITFVQQSLDNYNTASSSASSITFTLTNAPTNGNLLIATIGIMEEATAPTISSISQTGVTWTQQAIAPLTGYNHQYGAIWAGVVGSGASKSGTVTLSGALSSGTCVVDVCEWSGLTTSNFLDKTASASNANAVATSSTGTTSTTTQNYELCVGLTTACWFSQSSPINGFTLLDGNLETSGDAISTAYLYLIAGTTGTYGSGTTISGSTSWTGCIATFKATSTNPYPSVTLNSPTSGTTYAHDPVSFYFTPQSATSAQLWMNVSGTWQSVASTSTITNGQQNSIIYSMPQNSNSYVWNIEALNTAGTALAPYNFIITDSPLGSGMALTADGSNLLNSAGQIVLIRSVGVDGFAPDLLFWTSTGSDNWGDQWTAINSAAVTQTLQQLSTVWHVNCIRFFYYPEWLWTGTGAISLVPSTEGGGSSSTPVNSITWLQTFATECASYGIYLDMCPYCLVAGSGSFGGDPYANSGSSGLPMSSNWATSEQSFLTATGYGSNEAGFWTAFYTQMANNFKTYPNVIFEAWNEPAYTGYQNTVPSGFLNYLTIMYDAIRATGATNLIMMQWTTGWSPNIGATLGWASQITTAIGNPTNLVFTTHLYYYAPYDMTPQWDQNGIDNNAGGVPMTIAQIETQLQGAISSMGVTAPLVMNEEGDCCAYTANIANDYVWWNNLLQAQDALGIGAGAYYWLSSSGLGPAFGGEELLTSGYTPNTFGTDYINAYIS